MKVVSVGRITGLHGIKGYLKLKPWGEVEGKNWKRLFIFQGGSSRVLEIEAIRPHKTFLLVKIKGFDRRDSKLLSLVGAEAFIASEDIEPLPEAEYYWFELIGLKVYTENGEFLGVIREIFPTGSSDVFVVRGKPTLDSDEGREYLIPATKEVVISVDKEKGRVVIRPFEGLI